MTEMSKKQTILETALLLFNQFGYANIGVDTIVKHANVAKMTLYKQFGTKEGLIEETLRLRDQRFINSLQNYVDKASENKNAKIIAVFEWYKQWFLSKNFNGCIFIKASEEFGGRHENLSTIIKHHKNKVLNIIQTALESDENNKTNDKAFLIMLILEGLIVNMNMTKDITHFDSAMNSLDLILRDAD